MSIGKSSSLFRAVAATGMVNVVSMLLGIVSGVLTARGLGPDDRGEFISLIVWSATIGSLSLVGLDEAVVFQSQGEAPRAWALRSLVAKQAARQTALGAAALLAVAVHLVSPHGFTDWVVVGAVVCSVPLNSINLISVAPLRAARRLVTWNLVRSTQPVIFALSAMVLVLTHTLTVLSGVLATLTGAALTSLILLVIARREPRAALELEDRSRSLAYGRGLLFATLPLRLSVRADQLCMGLFMPAALLGVYSVALSVSAAVLMVGTSLDQVLFPRYVAQRRSREAVLKTAALGMLVAAAASLALMTIARWAIGALYGADYVAAISPLPLLLLAAVFQVGSAALGAPLRASGSLRSLARAYTVGLILFGIVFFLLLPLGMMGAALASAGASAGTLAILSRAVWLSASLASDRPTTMEVTA